MIVAAALRAAGDKQTNLIAVHFWHGVEALGFLVVALGGIGIVEWRERRQRSDRAAGTRSPAESAAATPSRLSPAQRSNLLTVAALCSAAAAAVHFVVMPDHFEESWMYGTFFLVTASAQVGYSVLLIARPSRGLLTVGFIANAGVVLLWLMTRLVAIPLGPGAGTTEAFSGLDVLASSFEVLFLITSLALLLPLRRATMPTPRPIRRVLLEPSMVAAVASVVVLIGVTAYNAPPS